MLQTEMMLKDREELKEIKQRVVSKSSIYIQYLSLMVIRELSRLESSGD